MSKTREITAAIETTKGSIRLNLFADTAPVTVGNFVNLARRTYYDGLSFHRVISDFMIQGGVPRVMEGADRVISSKMNFQRNYDTIDRASYLWRMLGPARTEVNSLLPTSQHHGSMITTPFLERSWDRKTRK